MVVTNQKNFVAGLLYIGLGGFVAAASSQYQLGTAARMGPGYFPLCLGIALAISGVCVVIGSMARGASPLKLGKWPLRNLGIITAAVILFGVTLEPFGLVVAAPILLGVATLANPAFSVRALLISIVVLTAFTWAVFIQLLGLQIPLLPSVFAT